MILLVPHIWVWWVAQPDRLQAGHHISCWEVAKPGARQTEAGSSGRALDRKRTCGPGRHASAPQPADRGGIHSIATAFPSRFSRPTAGCDCPRLAVSDRDRRWQDRGVSACHTCLTLAGVNGNSSRDTPFWEVATEPGAETGSRRAEIVSPCRRLHRRVPPGIG